MYLNEIVSAQKRGEPRGITSICSAHPWVLKAAMQEKGMLLIESTCNQVNQYGGYTGMTPNDFVRFVRVIADESNFPVENILLGGDHLGPNVWQNEPENLAMQKSAEMIKEYVQAGYRKIHLDCSMRLADDKTGVLNPEISARRTAFLAKVAEANIIKKDALPFYVIGTEVPVPGGAKEHEDEVRVTRVEDIQQTIDVNHRAFIDQGLEAAWERVIAIVVQPGVEFGDNFVLDYDPQKTREISAFIESQPFVYEVHSTDYQTQTALQDLVRDHFAILKVGPALTFAYREAIFTLAMIENELFSESDRSNLLQVIDTVMVDKPEYWQKYLHGTPEQLAFSRKYSLSDRIRYYWLDPKIQSAIEIMLRNLNMKRIPLSLLSQFLPSQYEFARNKKRYLSTDQLILEKINEVLEKYRYSC
jgi:D-tagatose-1,6-bisphosphate aldolase subunit GatZ/KbaZ